MPFSYCNFVPPAKAGGNSKNLKNYYSIIVP